MCSRVKKVFSREGKALQQDVHDVLRSAAGSVQMSFVDVPEVADKSLSLIVGQSKGEKSAWPKFLSAHSANRMQRQSRTSSVLDGGNALVSDAF